MLNPGGTGGRSIVASQGARDLGTETISPSERGRPRDERCMRVRQLIRIPFFSLLLAVGLVGACGGDDAQSTTPDAAEPDLSPDDIVDPSDGDDDNGNEETTEPDDIIDTTDVPEDTPDIDPDTPDVDEPDVPLPNCQPPSRLVGTRCATEFDRVCLTDDHCRDTELCIYVGDEATGTCIYQIPPPHICPGSEGCMDPDGPLRAGFGQRIITPIGWELARPSAARDPDPYGQPRRFNGDINDPTTFCDCGRDMICPPTPEYEGCPSFGEYTGPDEDGTEGDGLMQGAWLAGFGNNRLAQPCPDELLGDACVGHHCCVDRTAHDHMWARGFVLEQGDMRVALVSMDLVGFFYHDLDAIRSGLDPALGIDELIITSTHSHEVPDTMGRWGPGPFGSPLPGDSGNVPEHMADIYRAVEEVISDAVAELTEVDVYAAMVNTGTDGFAIRDSRDPFIFNDLINILQFVRAGEDRTNAENTLGTLVNWHSHPEALAGNNPYISSDFPHYVREYVENGFEDEVIDPDGNIFPAWDGLGGISVYMSGTVGGLLNPLSVAAKDRDGTEYTEATFDKAHALGARLADLILRTMDNPCDDDDRYGCFIQLEDTSVSFGTMEHLIVITNVAFHASAISLNLFDRPIYNWRSQDGTRGAIQPTVVTASAQLRIGPVAMQSFPGEVFTEVVLGGYSPDNVYDNIVLGDWRNVNCGPDLLEPLEEGVEPRYPCLVRASNPNPPDLSAAPTSGYVREIIPSEYLFTIGLGMDALGYLIPSYDFKTGILPGLSEVDGDHYEETVSPSDVVPLLLEIIEDLTEMLNDAR